MWLQTRSTQSCWKRSRSRCGTMTGACLRLCLCTSICICLSVGQIMSLKTNVPFIIFCTAGAAGPSEPSLGRDTGSWVIKSIILIDAKDTASAIGKHHLRLETPSLELMKPCIGHHSHQNLAKSWLASHWRKILQPPGHSALRRGRGTRRMWCESKKISISIFISSSVFGKIWSLYCRAMEVDL